jgi:hypothetical protein
VRPSSQSQDPLGCACQHRAVISTSLARRLREAGLRWRPQSGDRFQIDRAEFDSDVFTVSDLTIEAHEYATGTVLGFNGTTEWALDSVALEDALWLPREDQLRDLLRGAFVRLERDGDEYRVVLRGIVGELSFTSVSAPEAYGLALASLLERVRA